MKMLTGCRGYNMLNMNNPITELVVTKTKMRKDTANSNGHHKAPIRGQTLRKIV